MKKFLQPIEEVIPPQYDRTYIGNTLIVKLDEDRRVEIRFCTTGIVDHYDAIKFQLTSKTHGVINTHIVNFKTIFTSMIDFNHINRLNKHIWVCNGKADWYGKPLLEDIEALQNVAIDYIEMWK